MAGGHFQISGASDDGAKLAGRAFGKRESQAIDGLEADLQRESMRTKAGELIDVEIRDEISEMIRLEDNSGPDMLTGLRRLFKRRADIIFDALAEFSRFYSSCQVSGYGRKNVAAMKRSADGIEKIAFVGDVPHLGLLAREDH